MSEDTTKTEYDVTVSFRYAISIYDYMDANSSQVEALDLVSYGYPNTGEFAKVFANNIRTDDVGSKLGLNISQIGDGMGILKSMQSVTIIKRGGPKRPSLYVLNYKPTVEQYDEFRIQQGLASRRVMSSKYDQVLTENATIRIRMKAIEAELLENKNLILKLVEVNSDLLNRVRDLEARIPPLI